MVRIRELDGIRGAAILLVLVVHCCWNPELKEPLSSIVHLGWTGVDLFFVLSGYLITSTLLKTKTETTYFRAFYTNRLLRIFPLYYAFLLVATFVVSAPLWQWSGYWLYLGNFLNATGHALPSFGHFWSLAIEEQFYLIWPLVVYMVPLRRLTWLCVGAVIVMAVVRYGVVHFHLPSREFVYTLTPLRCDGLLLGALVACLQDRGILVRFSPALRWTAGVGLALLCYGVFRDHGTWYVDPPIERFGYLGVDVLFASLIAAVLVWQHSSWFKVTRTPLLVFFGKYSYAIYIFHLPIVRYLAPAMGITMAPLIRSVVMLLLVTSLSVVAALISWNLLEKRCLALKERLRAQREDRLLAAPA